MRYLSNAAIVRKQFPVSSCKVIGFKNGTMAGREVNDAWPFMAKWPYVVIIKLNMIISVFCAFERSYMAGKAEDVGYGNNQGDKNSGVWAVSWLLGPNILQQ
jgi:hypothetical protein